jgi:hypothetical protein
VKSLSTDDAGNRRMVRVLDLRSDYALMAVSPMP